MIHDRHIHGKVSRSATTLEHCTRDEVSRNESLKHCNRSEAFYNAFIQRYTRDEVSHSAFLLRYTRDEVFRSASPKHCTHDEVFKSRDGYILRGLRVGKKHARSHDVLDPSDDPYDALERIDDQSDAHVME